MLADSPNFNALWADLIVEELVRNGVDRFVVSPGSRSAPLALAAARNRHATVTVHFDERGAAFLALGIGKADRVPAAFLCTSGTAVANALPAVVEACECGVPLLLLTADRPPELLDTGANQTIRQSGMFANYARWAYDFPCPDAAIAPAAVLTAIDQAVYRATGHEAGPVHLNVPFREPLAPKPMPFDRATWLAPVSGWLRSTAPYTDYVPWGTGLENLDWQDVIRNTARGVILVGLIDDADERASAETIARTLGWPVLADPASGLRFVKGAAATAHFYDALLGSKQKTLFDGVETVLHLGGAMTSKLLNAWVGAGRYRHYVRVHPSPRRLDPQLRVTIRIQSNLFAFSLFVEDIAERVEPDAAWRERILGASKRAGRLLDKAFDAGKAISEQWVVRQSIATAPKRGAVFLGNSLPIRHADHFGPANAKCGQVFANRGASGIDGTVATAAGVARAIGQPVVAVIGDLAALHDLNSLALLSEPSAQVVLVILNNDGGGIFHLLPIADYPEHFEALFGTPHGRSFEFAAKQFGLDYAAPKSRADFEKRLGEFVASGRSGVIEVRTSREATARVARELRNAVEPD